MDIRNNFKKKCDLETFREYYKDDSSRFTLCFGVYISKFN